MNKRIQELALQAGMVTDADFASGGHFAEKFAELIIRKCAELNFRELGLSGSASFDVSRMIKQHFGVEE